MSINRIFLILFLFSFNLIAEDDPSPFISKGTPYPENGSLNGKRSENTSGYFIPGYTSSPEDNIEVDEKELLYFLPGKDEGMGTELKESDAGDNAFIVSPNPVNPPELSVGNIKDENVSQLPAGSPGLEISKFEGMDNMGRLEKFRNDAKSNINFSILYDNFSYGGPPGVYEETFEGSDSKLVNKLFFQAGYFLTFLKSFVNLSAGLNGGFSYKKGTGVFAGNNEPSSATLYLYALPLDLGVNLEFPIGPLFRISVSGGPSLMTLLQNRNDRDSGDSGKVYYQLSPGYFGEAKLKLNMGHIFKGAALDLFNSTQVTNFFLNFSARLENYNKFSEPSIIVDGTSYGIGLSFEFL